MEILQTLSADEFKIDATAIGLLSQLKTVTFIGKKAVLLWTFNIVFVQSYCVFTCWLLISHLLYRGYLRPQVYSSLPGNSQQVLSSSLQYAKKQLKEVATTEAPITVLKQVQLN